MKKLALLLLTVFSCQSASVLVTWWANPEPDIAGYLVHIGTNQNWITITNVGNQTNCIIDDIRAGDDPRCVAVKAVNTSGLQSELSDVLCFRVPYLPAPATAFTVSPGTNWGCVRLTWLCPANPDLSHFVLNYGFGDIIIAKDINEYQICGLTQGQNYNFNLTTVVSNENFTITGNVSAGSSYSVPVQLSQPKNLTIKLVPD